jgi:hypothetical protein
MARRGFRLVDVVAVTILFLLTLGLLLPAMARARYRSDGKRTMPSFIPPQVARLTSPDGG